MSFAAVEYLPYLLIVVVVFQFVPRSWRMGTLLVASWYFYADWKASHLVWLIGSTFVGHATALAMRSAATASTRRAWLAVSLAFHLALLIVFKYAGFLTGSADSLARWLGLGGIPVASIELPLGLSFYTLQVLSYSFDVYRRRMQPCASWTEFALFVAFFPQLVAGPIDRAEQLVPQLRATQTLTWRNLQLGAVSIAWGLAKKQVVADRLRAFASPIVADPEQHSAPQAWLGALALFVMLYADFSAYSDLARGSARLFGVELVENFRRPFAATTPIAFWQRWHISLWTWLVDYVQVPLTRARSSRLVMLRNTLIVLVLVGLWHGASWNFVLWGLLNGAFVIPFQITRWKPRRAAAIALVWLAMIAVGSTFMVLFFTPDLGAAASYLERMGSFASSGLRVVDVWVIAAFVGLLAVHLVGEFRDLPALWERIGNTGRVALIAAVAAFVLAFRVDESPAFVYFAF